MVRQEIKCVHVNLDSFSLLLVHGMLRHRSVNQAEEADGVRKFLCTDSPEEACSKHIQETSPSQSAFTLYLSFCENVYFL
jgi:hypothetical protein